MIFLPKGGNCLPIALPMQQWHRTFTSVSASFYIMVEYFVVILLLSFCWSVFFFFLRAYVCVSNFFKFLLF